MIVASPKSITELKNLIAGHKKVLFVGCGTCVTVCLAGGEREVGIASYAIRMARKLEGEPLELTQMTIERQCENEFIKDLAEPAAKVDAIVSFGCGVGRAGHRREVPREARLRRAQHPVHGHARRAGRLDREMPGLRRLHAGPVRRHLPGDALRQAAAERPLRRLDRRRTARWTRTVPAPGSSSTPASRASTSWTGWTKSCPPRTGAPPGTPERARWCAKSTGYRRHP